MPDVCLPRGRYSCTSASPLIPPNIILCTIRTCCCSWALCFCPISFCSFWCLFLHLFFSGLPLKRVLKLADCLSWMTSRDIETEASRQQANHVTETTTGPPAGPNWIFHLCPLCWWRVVYALQPSSTSQTPDSSPHNGLSVLWFVNMTSWKIWKGSRWPVIFPTSGKMYIEPLSRGCKVPLCTSAPYFFCCNSIGVNNSHFPSLFMLHSIWPPLGF